MPTAYRLVWHEEPSGRGELQQCPLLCSGSTASRQSSEMQAAVLGAAFLARLPRLADSKLLSSDLMLVLQDSTYKYFEIVMVDPHHKCVRKVSAIAGLHCFGKTWAAAPCSTLPV